MHHWRLRRAEPTDAPALASCVDTAYRHYIPRIGKPPGPMLANYTEGIARHQVWVAEAEGQTIGGLVLIPARDSLLLDNIAMHPDHQGRGVGRALLELADAEALSQGYRELRLYTHETMTENIALYTRSGRVETHRSHQAGYARVFMHKRMLSPDYILDYIEEDGDKSCIMRGG
jgi:GNAT superfamily N-acetyltransferase